MTLGSADGCATVILRGWIDRTEWFCGVARRIFA
jgi:hypothetical protein